MENNFSALSIPDFLVEKLRQSEIVQPTQVQKEAIPYILEGKDVISSSPTGSGKTLAYLLPILSKIDVKSKNLQSLVLAPSRELAMQIQRVIKEFAPEELISVPLIGGANIARQIDSLKKKPQIAVGTPGRVLELMEKNKINTSKIASLIIDEADKMFSSGFIKDLQGIIKGLKGKQILLFSATMSHQVVNQFLPLMDHPETIRIEESSRVPSGIEHFYFLSQEKDKVERFKKLISLYRPQKAIIFLNHNEGVITWTKFFQELGLSCLALHSELSELARKNILAKFREGKSLFLVTTDMFARGLDISGVDFVFNFDVPESAEHYLHRVGRTGRAGKKGVAVTLVTEKQKFIMKKYSRLLRINIQQCGIANDKIIIIKLG